METRPPRAGFKHGAQLPPAEAVGRERDPGGGGTAPIPPSLPPSLRTPQRAPGLRDRREPLPRPFVQGWAAPRPPHPPSSRSRERSEAGGRRRRAAAQQGLWEYSPRSAGPTRRPATRAGPRGGGGEGSGAKDPAPGQQPPAARLGEERDGPPGATGVAAAEPSPRGGRLTRGGAEPSPSPSPPLPPPPPPRAAEREHARCASRAPWGLPRPSRWGTLCTAGDPGGGGDLRAARDHCRQVPAREPEGGCPLCATQRRPLTEAGSPPEPGGGVPALPRPLHALLQK